MTNNMKAEFKLISPEADILNKPLPEFKDEILPEGFTRTKIAEDLFVAMKQFGGIGLSANQVGLPYRMFVTEGDPGFACFNPRITAHAGDEVLLEEGCLSYPGLYIKKKRPQIIRVRFFSPTGQPVVKRFSGMTSRIFQHEMEHMDGENYLEGVNNLVLQRAKRKQEILLRKVRRQVEGRSKHGNKRRR